jgi:hypothetical protein
MKITNASAAWSAGTVLADNETWQVHDGAVLLDTDANEAERLGIRLLGGDSMDFSAGRTVYYQLASGTTALIARVAK